MSDDPEPDIMAPLYEQLDAIRAALDELRRTQMTKDMWFAQMGELRALVIERTKPVRRTGPPKR